jgi:hypothetical protein
VAAGFSGALQRHADHDLARPAFFELGVHAHRGHRLRDDHLYNGGYDDMVEQKTAIRSRIESQNEQREKKIAQLNDFIARFSAGTRSSQVNSRKKEVERLATTELARSNIQRPYIRFEQKRPSGRHVLEIEEVSKAYEQKDGSPLQVIDKFSALPARRQDCADGAQRAGEDHADQGAAGECAGRGARRMCRSTRAR